MTPAWFRPPPQVKPGLAAKKTKDAVSSAKKYRGLRLSRINKI